MRHAEVSVLADCELLSIEGELRERLGLRALAVVNGR
jgi:hypothetical protein